MDHEHEKSYRRLSGVKVQKAKFVLARFYRAHEIYSLLLLDVRCPSVVMCILVRSGAGWTVGRPRKK